MRGLSRGTIARVMAMTGMKRLIGLPVILEGKQIGSVVRGVVREDGRALSGLVVRDGLWASRFVAAEEIRMLGRLPEPRQHLRLQAHQPHHLCPKRRAIHQLTICHSNYA